MGNFCDSPWPLSNLAYKFLSKSHECAGRKSPSAWYLTLKVPRLPFAYLCKYSTRGTALDCQYRLKKSPFYLPRPRMEGMVQAAFGKAVIAPGYRFQN